MDTGNVGLALEVCNPPMWGFLFFFFSSRTGSDGPQGSLLLCLCLHPQLGSHPGQLILPRLQAAQGCKTWQGKEEKRLTG